MLHLANKCFHALFHVARGLVGKGDSENAPRLHVFVCNEVGDSVDKGFGFSTACTSENEDWPSGGLDGERLLVIEGFEDFSGCSVRANCSSSLSRGG